MTIPANSPEEYLAGVDEARRPFFKKLRETVVENLPDGFEERLSYGMIGYVVPHEIYPAGYHCDPRQPLPFAALASQKNYLSLYLMGMYCGCTETPGSDESGDARWFRETWAKTGKKLDIGKACVRFKKTEDLALDVIGEAIRRLPAKTYIARYEKIRAAMSPPTKSAKVQ